MLHSRSASAQVERALVTMSTEEKIGQLLLIDFPSPTLDDGTLRHLRHRPWGGVILFAKNLSTTHGTQRMTQQLQAVAGETHSAVPYFISVDQEGGFVTRILYDRMVANPGAMALGAGRSGRAAFEAGRITAQELRALGINMNFAPVMDVNNNPANPIIGIRSFGEDPGLVGELGAAFIRGQREAGVISCAKHFPGHGDTALDSHLTLPTIRHDPARLHTIELAPFAAAIEAQVETIMTAHITYPGLDPRPGVPATLSAPILTGLLRNQMGFDGVIVTDSLAMKAIADRFGMDQAAVRSIDAGADLILACGTAGQQEGIFRALRDAVRSGRISDARLDESVRRILGLKYAVLPHRPKLHPLTEDHCHGRMREIARLGITLLKDDPGTLPLLLDRTMRLAVVAPESVPSSPMGLTRQTVPLAKCFKERHGFHVREIPYALTGGPPAIEALEHGVADADAVVFACFAKDRLPQPQAAIARRLLATGRPLVAVSLGSPYVALDLANAPTLVLTYSFQVPALQALADVILGDAPPQGTLPVTIPGLYPAGHGLGFQPRKSRHHLKR